MSKQAGRIFLSLSVVILFFYCGISLAQSDLPAPIDPAAELAKTGTVSGRIIVKDGGSMAGGNVLFYSVEQGPPPKKNKYIRVPSLVGEIGPDGSFSVELPVGRFYFSAVKRNSGEKYGKLQKGDYRLSLKDENNSAFKEFSLTEGQHIDLGILEAIPKQNWSVKPFMDTLTTIEGSLLNMDGNPVTNGVVLGYSTPRMQGQRPLFVSNFTGIDGKYTLRVAGGSTYYLMAREILGGGKLEVGEIIGVYGEYEPVGVSVKAGEAVGGINITVSRVQPRNPRELAEAGAGNSTGKKTTATGYLTGEVAMVDGTPLSGAFVYLFDAEKKQPAGMKQTGEAGFWWELDQIAGQLDRHGRFDVEVPVGSYHLTIIKRTSGKIMEPLQQGDLYYRHRVSADANKSITIKTGEETNLGKLVAYQYTARGVTDYPNAVAIASIYGTLTDKEGEPVPDAYILVYSEPDRLGPPLFSGGPSKADGSYNMMFYEEGTYYLVAKAGTGFDPGIRGISRPDIMLGRYGGNNHKPLIIKKNDVITGIDIVLQPVGMVSWTD